MGLPFRIRERYSSNLTKLIVDERNKTTEWEKVAKKLTPEQSFELWKELEV